MAYLTIISGTDKSATAKTATAIRNAGETAITADFRNPARYAAININADSIAATDCPDAYRPIVEAALRGAAEGILSSYLKAYSVWPADIDEGTFARAAIIDAAINSGTAWLTKEEMTAAWKASATRAGFLARADYATNKALRQAVDRYEELVLKLAGKTSQFESSELDTILAKLSPADLETEMGNFIARRIDAIKNKPAPTVVNIADIL